VLGVLVGGLVVVVCVGGRGWWYVVREIRLDGRRVERAPQYSAATSARTALRIGARVPTESIHVVEQF